MPIRNLVSEKAALKMKIEDIKNQVPYQRSYGVSDTEEVKRKDKLLIRQGRLLECTSLKFEHRFDNIILNNYHLGESVIQINYDRTGNILIGMDILSYMDIHMGAAKYAALSRHPQLKAYYLQSKTFLKHFTQGYGIFFCRHLTEYPKKGFCSREPDTGPSAAFQVYFASDKRHKKEIFVSVLMIL